MPFILYVLVFTGAILLFRSDIGEEDRRREADLVKTIAPQMVWYHNAAVRSCLPPISCAPGEVLVSEAAMNPNGTMALRLVALTDGRWVVTTWRNAPRNGRGEPKQGAVALELRELSQNSIMVGMFDSTNCQINSHVPSKLSSAIGGVALHHGAATIATRVGDAPAGPCTGSGGSL